MDWQTQTQQQFVMQLFNTPLKVVQWRVSCGRAWLKECPPRHAVVVGIIAEVEHVYCAVRTETLHIICMYILMLRAMDQKHLESFDMWCWRKMENIK